MSAFDFIICFASRLLRGLLAVHYFLYFIVSAFDFIICLASRLWRGPLAVQCFYLTMWQPLILHSMLSLALSRTLAVHCLYMTIGFGIILHMCSQMPFECTNHIRPPFQVRPLHSAFCTCLNILELGLSCLLL